MLKYEINRETSKDTLANILKDWAFNMRKADGTDYKESVIKSMWNVTANMIREQFHRKYGISINPFTDQEFREARLAKDTKRKELQRIPEYRKRKSDAPAKLPSFTMRINR